MKPAKQSWVLAGGLLSALAASLCCLGPLVAIVLGVGGFAASSWFAAWRPYFLAASFGLLALAWYLTYRRPQTPCAEGEACSPASARKGPKLFLWIVTALAIPAALFPSLRSFGSTSTTGAATADGTELRVRIPSMDCIACAKGIEATLRRTPGVLRAMVDYDSKNAGIVFDSSKTTARQLIATIDRTGFKAEKVSQTSVPSSDGVMAKADACCAPESSTPPAKNVATTRNTMNPDRISLFTVPLVCAAAPEIGCGSKAKPRLAALERDASIAEAWLNSTGTVLVVVGNEGSTRESRAKAVRSVFESRGEVATELDGEARQQNLDDFFSRDEWYRSAAVDQLSQQEARIIAARLVRRVQTKIPLADTKARAMEARIASVFERRFIDRSPDRVKATEQQRADELIAMARELLDGSEIAVFREALAAGIGPQTGEK